MNIGYIYVFLTVVFGCIANMLAKMSKSFTDYKYGTFSILSIILVMIFLSKAYDNMSVGLVYSIHSVSLLLFTIILGYCVYHEKPDKYTIIGVIFVLIGIIFINILGSYSCE